MDRADATATALQRLFHVKQRGIAGGSPDPHSASRLDRVPSAAPGRNSYRGGGACSASVLVPGYRVPRQFRSPVSIGGGVSLPAGGGGFDLKSRSSLDRVPRFVFSAALWTGVGVLQGVITWPGPVADGLRVCGGGSTPAQFKGAPHERG